MSISSATRVKPALARELAAVFACGEGAVLSHHSAASLWGLLAYDGDAHVTVSSGLRGRDGIRVHRAREIPACDLTTHHGIRVTAPGRTLLDLADVVAPRTLERAFGW